MLFNSNLFLFLFLPVALIGFYLCQRLEAYRLSVVWLGLMSLVFYSWDGFQFLPLLCISIISNFVFGRLLTRYRHPLLLLLAVTFNLGLLAFFKYGGFILDNISSITAVSHAEWNVALPIGISFYTFTQIAYLVDAYRRYPCERDPARYVLFVTFFPHLIAGPILHHKEMMPQFGRRVTNSAFLQNLLVGTILLSIGLGKKCLIADPLGAFASPIFDQTESGRTVHFFIAWAATFAYTFQIYFDFSGYSDMALGLARMFGVIFPANFNSPYIADSIIEFWRRWHMTLSRFLRDYIYIPLGGSRHGSLVQYRNLILTMLIGGLWHGASWTFALWGLLHGIYLLTNHLWRHLSGSVRIVGQIDRLYVRPVAVGITFVAVAVAWVTFRAPTLNAAIEFYRVMFLFDGVSLPAEFAPFLAAVLPAGLVENIYYFAENDRTEFYTGCAWVLGAGVIAFLMPNSLEITARARPCLESDRIIGLNDRSWARRPASAVLIWLRDASVYIVLCYFRLSRFGIATALFCGLLMFLALRAINSSAETEFLYFQF